MKPRVIWSWTTIPRTTWTSGLNYSFQTEQKRTGILFAINTVAGLNSLRRQKHATAGCMKLCLCFWLQAFSLRLLGELFVQNQEALLDGSYNSPTGKMQQGRCYCSVIVLHLPLGWNIFDMNLTVGGLLGYSSVNSICNLNVPIAKNKNLFNYHLIALNRQNEITLQLTTQ